MPDKSTQDRKARSIAEPAQGFYDLGMYSEAWAALDELPVENRAHPITMSLRLDILLALHRLDDAVALGIGACRQWPNVGSFFLRTGSALIVLSDHEKAKALLLAAPPILQENAAYWFDLARCQGRTGDINMAKKSIQECVRRDESYRAQALDDPDLEAVWKSI